MMNVNDDDGDYDEARAYNRTLFRNRPPVSDYVESTKQWCLNSFARMQQKQFYKSLAFKRLPVLKWLFIEYDLKRDLVHDIIAGLIVGIMNMPQSMGYALLASLPAVHGLYMSFFPILIYFLLGTSRHLAIGAIAIVSLFSGNIIQTMGDDYRKTLVNVTSNGTDELVMEYKIHTACALAAFVGLLQLLIGLTGLGAVTDYFSDAFVSGYTSSSAVHVLASQLKDLLGLKHTNKYNGALKIPKTIIDVISKAKSTNLATLVISIISIFYLIVFKELLNPRIKKKIMFDFPAELLLVVGVTMVSYYGHLSEKYGIDIVKTIPTGLPSPHLPDLSIWGDFIKDGILAALIATSISISLTKLYAKKNKYDTHSTQELYAYGSSNIFASLFGCWPASGSLTRTTMLHSTGGRSQIASLVSAIIILIVILWIGPLFQPLAIACLASIIVVALRSLLFQIKDFFYLWRINRYEALTWIVTYLSVVLLDVDIGLFIGLASNLLLVIIKDQRFEVQKLIKYKNLPIYLDREFLKTGENMDALNAKVLKVERSLYFVNIEMFKKHLYKLYEHGLKQIKAEEEEEDINESMSSTTNILQMKESKYLLLDFSAVNYVDHTAIQTLLEMIQDFKQSNIHIYICQSQLFFIQMINKMDLIEQFEQNLFITVQDAVEYIERLN